MESIISMVSLTVDADGQVFSLDPTNLESLNDFVQTYK